MAAVPPADNAPLLAKPTAKQIRVADGEVGAFNHDGLNVYTGQEHGDGKEPPSKFNPTDLDVEDRAHVVVLSCRGSWPQERHAGG